MGGCALGEVQLRIIGIGELAEVEWNGMECASQRQEKIVGKDTRTDYQQFDAI